ncbi:ATP-grasp domain-containing protein [Methanorbis furvi]|uniref:Glutathione synthetase n=1 Tax=Methanorbis furvi TaxID=3028299 RepID=A0AAE4MAP6_9EURY|nr:Glutathione synthetase [Methanocorpusculaceae archaeon Ag1]
MIHIIPKPTDTPGDNSTGMVMAELKRMNVPFEVLNLASVDPFNLPVDGETIWACGIKQDGIQFELLKALELTNRVINSPEAIATCASKVTTTAMLINAGAPSPDTCFTNNKKVVADFLASHDGKAVYKPVYGFDGNGIYLFNSVDQITEAPPYYVQQYVKNDRDYRIFVIGNKAVGAIKRESDHLTHNIHQGGCGTAVEIPADMRAAAEAAARAIGIDYCGVDLLPLEDGGYTVLEVNGTPNWHCMTAPIPRLLAEYLVEQDKLGKC